jgi:ribonuclease P protein component
MGGCFVLKMHPEKKSFTKGERLCSKKLFAELFEKGNTFYSFPFRVVWIYSPATSSSPSQIAISVPKRVFKKAVDRNLIKRRIREAFRKNKHDLYNYLEQKERHIAFILIFKDVVISDYSKTEKDVLEMLKKLLNILKEKEHKC